MIYAEIAGRLGFEEDILTSTAIGLLSLLPDEEFIRFIGRARSIDGECLEKHIGTCTRVEAIEFWKTGFLYGIPDVFLRLEGEAGVCAAIVIEVKHRSGKSGSAEEVEDGVIQNREVDQLYRYWESLAQQYPNCRKAVVFLTGHRILPRKDLETSSRAAGGEARLFWLGWHSVYDFVAEALRSGKYPTRTAECKILQLLETYLRFKGYARFSGWPQPAMSGIVTELRWLWYQRLYTLNLGLSGCLHPAYCRTYVQQVPGAVEAIAAVFYKP
ncbi:MAG: hypothetical protein H5U02_01425 [Clostridia bacterium]|nr:hypothetical protein [Clostridia bacterium]